MMRFLLCCTFILLVPLFLAAPAADPLAVGGGVESVSVLVQRGTRAEMDAVRWKRLAEHIMRDTTRTGGQWAREKAELRQAELSSSSGGSGGLEGDGGGPAATDELHTARQHVDAYVEVES